MIAALSGCAQTSGLAQLTLLSSDEEAQPEIAAQGSDSDPAEGPPLPIRNAWRKGNDAAKLASSSSKGEFKQAGLTLPSLPDVKLFTATAAYAPNATQWSDPPITVYTQLAQQIHACWFTPGAPKLTNHGFHAEVAPDDASTAKIIIYQKDPNGKRGLQVFRISIDGALTGSTVTAENRRLEKSLETSFRTDLARWSKGNRDCKG